MSNRLNICTTTRLVALSLSLLVGCQRAPRAPQSLDEPAIQSAVTARFLQVRDTLALQHLATCDSLEPLLIRQKVDSLVMDYFRRNDTISLDMEGYERD